jgi:hypothetical protein
MRSSLLAVRVAWVATIALSGLIVVNTLPYFTDSATFAFLREKGALAADPLWRGAFHAHVAGGIVCLVTGPFLLHGGLLRRAPWLHRLLGRLHVGVVLGMAGPAGMVLAVHAKGGAAGRAGFVVLGVLWWASTAHGLALVLRGRIAAHRRWMLRSYALALSAVFFRVILVALFAAGLDDETNYVVSLWLSLAVSLGVGEVLARAPAGATSRRVLEGAHA